MALEKPRRYWNDSLVSQYSLFRPIAGPGVIHVRQPSVRHSDGRTRVIVHKQTVAATAVATGIHFQPLLLPGYSSALAPKRPDYATLPADKRKRGVTTNFKKKTALGESDYTRCVKIRLHPTEEQKSKLKTMFAAARMYYNETIAMLNAASDGMNAEDFLQALSTDDEQFTDGEQDAAFWYSYFRAEASESTATAGSYPKFQADTNFPKPTHVQPFGPYNCMANSESSGFTAFDEATGHRLDAALIWEQMSELERAPFVRDFTDSGAPEPVKLDANCSPYLCLHPSERDAWEAAERLLKKNQKMKHPKEAWSGVLTQGIREVIKEIVRQKAEWTLHVPEKICQAAIRQAVDARDTNVSKMLKNPDKANRFQLRFRSLKNMSFTPTESITIDTTSAGGCIRAFTPCLERGRSGTTRNSRTDINVVFGPSVFGPGLASAVRATDKPKWVNKLLADATLKKTAEIVWDKRVNKFFLIAKYVVTRAPDSKAPDEQTPMALDPGVRTFNMGYTPDGSYTEFGVGAKKHMTELARKADRLQSKLESIPKKDRQALWAYSRTMRGRLRRIRRKAHNWMKQVHYETAKHMLDTADVILMPAFETSQMVRVGQRVFNSQVARDMYTWGHALFRQRLWFKVQVTPDKAMAWIYEPGTSRTCDACGHVMPKNGSQVFHCHACGHHCERDAHGARGNMLAAFGAAQGVGWDYVER